MSIEQATQIVEFLAKYNEHFIEVVSFLKEKEKRVLADDLVWLLDSLAEEQRLSMSGSSLESKRIELLAGMGFDDKTSSDLLEIFPEEGKGRFKLECTNIEAAINEIKLISENITETVEKKMAVAEHHMKEQGIAGPGFYDPGGGKVRISDPDDDIIGEM